MGEIEVRDAHGAELLAGCALLARSLGFCDRDALPPWLVQTAAGFGGLALGAFAAGRLVGFSFALPTAGDELFSCGVAVDPEWRGRGVGARLKRLQRERARARGVTAIRWTADPLAAPALALYLGTLGARLVGYAPGLYAAVRPAAVEPDDVVIEWPLGAPPPLVQPVGRVEIPLDVGALAGAELARRRRDVRRAMTHALARGGVGCGVTVERDGGRAWVLFRARS
jgi:predicted GNAT superfamily acetyltransferase